MKCCICGKEIKNNPYGNNAAPIVEGGRCCRQCDEVFVIPARAGVRLNIEEMKKGITLYNHYLAGYCMSAIGKAQFNADENGEPNNRAISKEEREKIVKDALYEAVFGDEPF